MLLLTLAPRCRIRQRRSPSHPVQRTSAYASFGRSPLTPPPVRRPTSFCVATCCVRLYALIAAVRASTIPTTASGNPGSYGGTGRPKAAVMNTATWARETEAVGQKRSGEVAQPPVMPLL